MQGPSLNKKKKICIKPLIPTNIFEWVLSRIETNIATKILLNRLVEIIIEKGIWEHE